MHEGQGLAPPVWPGESGDAHVLREREINKIIELFPEIIRSRAGLTDLLRQIQMESSNHLAQNNPIQAASIPAISSHLSHLLRGRETDAASHRPPQNRGRGTDRESLEEILRSL